MNAQTSVHVFHAPGRRAATISVATLLLCLAGAAPALAATTPLPIPTGPTSVSTVPEPPPPAGDLVQQLSQTAGVPDPLASDPAAPLLQQPPKTNTLPPTRKHRHRSTPAVAPTTHRGSTTQQLAMAPAVPAAIPVLRGMPVATSSVSGALAPPDVAGPGSSTTAQFAAHARSAMDALTGGGVPARRMVALILGTLIIGLLAAGHIRVAQEKVDALA